MLINSFKDAMQEFQKPCRIEKSDEFFITSEYPKNINQNESNRQITVGFSFMQQLGKKPKTACWLNGKNQISYNLANRIQQHDANILAEFNVEWAAVRQFEILQEGTNAQIRSFDVEDWQHSFHYIKSVKGSRITLYLITMGIYSKSNKVQDQQALLDEKLKEKISELLSLIYLEKQSSAMSKQLNKDCINGSWKPEKALSDIVDNFKSNNLLKKSNDLIDSHILNLLNIIDSKQVNHTVFLGLTIPNFNPRQFMLYIPHKDETFIAFQTVLTNVFKDLDMIQLDVLQERSFHHSEIRPTMMHPLSCNIGLQK